MYQYTVTQWVFLFYFYCFCGWCFESAYVSARTRKWTNRGFLHGPFLPLYGSGATMMLVVSMPFQDNLFLTYLAGCVGATILEYVTGVVMEALFKVRYWDYSYKKFQFQGHICLSSTLAWGGCTILMTEVIQKPVEQVLFWVPGQLLTAVTFILTAVIFADFSLSFKAAMDLRDILFKLENARAELGHMQKRLDVVIALTADEMEQKVAEYREQLRQRRESLAGAIEEKKENLAEAIGEKKDNLVGAIGEKKENLAEAVAGVKVSISGAIEDKKDDFTQLIEEWMEEFAKSSHQPDSEQIKQGILQKLAGRQKEVLRRQTELMGSCARQVKNIARANPSVMSKRFREIFEELREKEKDPEEKS